MVREGEVPPAEKEQAQETTKEMAKLVLEPVVPAQEGRGQELRAAALIRFTRPR
jgi:hypothetical protein